MYSQVSAHCETCRNLFTQEPIFTVEDFTDPMAVIPEDYLPEPEDDRDENPEPKVPSEEEEKEV